MTINKMPPRPTLTHDIILKAAQAVASRLRGRDAEDIARHYRHPMDGFELCKELDKWERWGTTREDMDVLDEMEWLVSQALKDAEKEWQIENMITPPLPIGATIKCSSGVGTITGIDEYRAARYLVKPEGQDDSQSGNMRWIIKFEDAELVER